MVAFLDYNCPYCREGTPDLAKLVSEDGKVRLVLKELPVLGPESEDVARIAQAAIAQGKISSCMNGCSPSAAGRPSRRRFASPLS